LRDVIQNHGLQLMSLVAMEPPAGVHDTTFENAANHRASERTRRIRPLDGRRP
ncbi:MAG: glucose-6-phosphate dehydrogenase, partial [Anaerolineae bacterium]|nr:glucose-6-phosphate dehydrogenase [Anaerolineae bacterium]